MSRKYSWRTCLLGRAASPETFRADFERYKVEWRNSIEVCTDGAANMNEDYFGVVEKIWEVVHSDAYVAY